jgi:acetylornithine aminotransferase/acetylornithine/N-succinyldiaminopimelate aminotransferase
VLDVIEKEKLLAHVSAQGFRWLAELTKLAQAFPQHIAAVRGRGFLVGVQLTADPAPLLADLRERGLLVVPSGNNVLRFLPPLVATAAELDQATVILRAALAAKG